MTAPSAPSSRRARTIASLILGVLGVVALILGGVCLYVRQELLSPKRFADRTVSALGKDPVRRVVAREMTVQVIDRASPDLLAARPLITSAVETIVATPQFGGVAHTAAENAHRLLFDRGGNVAFSIADAGTVVISAVRALAPNVAKQIPASVGATLLDLRRRSFAVSTLRVADKIRTLGLVLPLVALALLAGAIALASQRRLAVARCATALAVAGLSLFVDMALLRGHTLSKLFGAEQLSNADVRAAAGALWDSYLGGLSHWALGLAIGGAIVAAAAVRLVPPRTAAAGVVRLRGLVPPRTRFAQVAVGAATVIAGGLLIGWPATVLRVAVVACGVILVYVGVFEVLAGLGVETARERLSPAPSRWAALATVSGLGVLVGGAAIALAAAGGSSSHPPALVRLGTCNGYPQLCARRLDQVVFAGTHNAMSAADSPGWLIANQSRDIARQLNDGIRAFKISTHYGLSDGRGHVVTDIAAEGQRANRVAEKLSPEGRAALQRLSSSIAFGNPSGKPSVWLCHTQCEIGATSMLSFMRTVARFLASNPEQVLIFFDEDYVSEASLEDEFKRAGLYPHLAVLRLGQQLPTLGELVRSQHNVLVFTQEPVSGRYPWDMYGFDWIQDTPLGAVKPAQFTCKHYRGLQSSPLLMLNNWADVFPPLRSPNLALVKRDFIIRRARQCEAERHHMPNIILTDFYDGGDVIGAARVLNGLGEEAPAPIAPVQG